MARLNVPPTKSNLLRLKRELEFAREGFDMLDQKRQILVLELMGMVESAKRTQQEVQERMAAAFTALRDALIRVGSLKISLDATAARSDHWAEVENRPLMGISLPRITATHPEVGPVGSLLAGTCAQDEVARRFTEAIKNIDHLAEIENSVFRLAREARKTQRRVNALEKIFIPSYENELSFIGDVLEEKERDEFIVMRIVKDRLEEERRAPEGPF